jgi:hypothetical protein
MNFGIRRSEWRPRDVNCLKPVGGADPEKARTPDQVEFFLGRGNCDEESCPASEVRKNELIKKSWVVEPRDPEMFAEPQSDFVWDTYILISESKLGIESPSLD